MLHHLDGIVENEIRTDKYQKNGNVTLRRDNDIYPVQSSNRYAMESVIKMRTEQHLHKLSEAIVHKVTNVEPGSTRRREKD